MKRVILLLCLVMIYMLGYTQNDTVVLSKNDMVGDNNSQTVAQKKEKDFVIFSVFNEFTVSLNRTTVSDHNTEDRFGFGLGVFRAFFNQKRCNLVVGVEYNRSSQFKKKVVLSQSVRYNVVYNLDNVGIPIFFRVNMGKKVKFFLECGGFGEFNIVSTKEGGKRTKGAPLLGTHTVNYGISGGLGLRIPIERYEILIKGDYKWGIRNIINDYSKVTDLYNRYWRFTMGFKINPRNSVVLY